MRTLVLQRVSIAAVFVVLALVLLSLASSDATRADHDPGNPQYDPYGGLMLCNDQPDNFDGPAELQGPCGYDAGNTEDGDDEPDQGPPAECGDDIDNDGDTLKDIKDHDCHDHERGAAPGTHPDLTTVSIWPAGHLMLGEVSINTLDPEFHIAKGTVDDGTSTILEGQAIAGFRSLSTLGLAANPCSNGIWPEFILWNATIDTSPGNIVVLDPEGTADRYASLAIDDLPDGGGPNDDYGGKADPDSPIVDKYPDIALRQFDPDGTGDSTGGYDPVQPWARYAGLTQVPPGGDWQLLQIYVFPPGLLQAAFGSNPTNSVHPFVRVNPEEGWTHITILNDATATVSQKNPISDYCSESNVTAVVLGNPGGQARLTAPPVGGGGVDGEGSYLGAAYGASQRDTDGDGLENGLDTCPFTHNIDDPYDTNGVDQDMIDPACDPTPLSPTKYDATLPEDGFAAGTCGDTLDNGGDTKADINDDDCHIGNAQGDIDGDEYSNSQDNCPLVWNDPNEDIENSLPRVSVAPDGGPRGDGIGDPCDPDDAKADGLFKVTREASATCIRADHATADADNDGWCDAGADPDGGDQDVTGSDDQDGDGDGYKDPIEKYMNTDPKADCPVTTSHKAWPPDFDNNKTINILDIVQLTPPTFGAVKGVDPEYTDRKDLNADTVINILDIVKLTPPQFGTGCGVATIWCAIIRGPDGTIDTNSCEEQGGVVVTNTVGDETTVTVTFAGLCTDGGSVGAFASIWSSGSSTVTGTATCPTATATVGPIGPVAWDSDVALDKDPGDFVCTAVFNVTDTPYTAVVHCVDP
jgi:hypothetical protein